MLGDADGSDGAGFAVLDAETFEVKGRWEANGAPRWNYDFWYNPANGYLVSSEWASPSTFQDGFDLEHLAAGRYGRSIHIWDLDKRQVVQDIDLGEEGVIRLEIRTHPRPGGVPGPGAGADHRPGGLHGRPLPVLLQLAARRPAPVRHQRPGPAGAQEQRQPGRPVRGGDPPQRHPADRRAPDAPAVDGRPPPVRHQLALLQLGQPVLPGPARLDAEAGRRRRRAPGRPGLLRRLPPARAHEIHLPGGDPTTEIFS
jgi:hypothetical protein